MAIYIKRKKRKSSDALFFMHQFAEACEELGFIGLDANESDSLLAKIVRKIMMYVPYFLRKKKDFLIVPSNGETLSLSIYPYYRYNIIPMLWDVWPHTWKALLRDLKNANVKIVFTTVSAMAEKLRNLGYQSFWIPEGIDTSLYSGERTLEERTMEVYELGRRHVAYHKVLSDLIARNVISSHVSSHYDEDGGYLGPAFATPQELISSLSDIKIVINFPQVDTNPQRAGGMETLTQRYWESMLSGCLMVGRAPDELVQLIGYNPVVDVDWEQPDLQIEKILINLNDYQKLVDKNRETALKFSPWLTRVKQIKSILKELKVG